MDVPQFDVHLPTEGQLGGFQFLPVMNKVAVDIHVQKKKKKGREKPTLDDYRRHL